jgi:hypothetical protein
MPSGWGALKATASQDSSVFGVDAADAPSTANGSAERRDYSHSSSRDDVDPATLGPWPDSYVVTGAPPPCGQGAPRTPNEFLNISVGTTRKNLDATGKDVIWYDITVRTTTHQWLVSKRFSDFVQVHESLRKLQLNQYMEEVQEQQRQHIADVASSPGAGSRGNESARSTSSTRNVTTLPPATIIYRYADFPPPFPSRFHIRNNMDARLVENRRLQLDNYWKGVLRYLQGLTMAAIGVKKPYSAALRSAFAVMADFLRSSSQTESTDRGLWAKEDPYAQLQPSSPSSAGGNGIGTSPARAGGAAPAFGSPLTSSAKVIFAGLDVEQQPPCKIVLESGARFTIVFFLPGVLLGDIYVDATGDRDRSVIIGGRWNGGITGLESLRDQGVFQHSALVSATTPTAASMEEGSVLGSSQCGGSDRIVSARQRLSARSGGAPQKRRGERSVLMDTLPRGDFEMVFDVPSPFERAHWYSEYEGGVLLIMWDAPAAS